MWTGDTQSQGGSYPTQWALNPTAYVNVPNEQVDWASLAQQWIKMKEGLPQNEEEEEEGEAPMDITKEETIATPTTPSVPATSSWNVNQPIAPDGGAVWPNNWGWEGGGWWMNDPKLTGATGGNFTTPGYTSVPEPSVPPAAPPPVVTPQTSFHYTAPAQPANNQHFSTNPGYWTETPDVKESWETNSTRSSRKQSAIQESISDLDSAKRKQLPAWIREGLEKMEREKQKKAESERLERQRQEELARQHQDQEPPDQEIVEANGSPALPKKSKFETDSDESDDEKEVADEKIIDKIRKSRFDRRLPEQPSFVKPVFHSKEEILQYVMREVRKTLTQLLMEVTTEEMRAAAEEVHNQFQRKAPATTVRKTQALASLTGKLGLGIYDSDSGSENSETEGAVNGADSDQELRERIMRRKEDFLDTEEQINKEVAESEEKERRVLSGKKSASREVSPEMEEQVQPTQQGAVIENKIDRKIVADNEEEKSIELRESKSENKTLRSSRDRHETKKDSDKSSQRKSDRKSRKHSSVSSSSSEYSRSPSPYRKRKHNKHKRDRRSRRSRTKTRSRSRDKSRSRSRGWSRDRSRERKYRRKDRRYRSRSSSKRRRSTDRRSRYRSSSSSSGGVHSKKSSYRR